MGDTPKVSVIFLHVLSDVISESGGDGYFSDGGDEDGAMMFNSDCDDEPVSPTQPMIFYNLLMRHSLRVT